LQPSGPRPEASTVPALQSTAEGRGLPYQWNLLAWAALVGLATGLAVVGFHELLGFINNFLFGPFVEGLLAIARSGTAPPPELPSLTLASPPPAPLTPLTALLKMGLGGIGFLPPPPAPPP